MFVRIDLIEGYGSFVGWLTQADTDVEKGWIAAEGRWLRPDGTMFKEQNLRRPWAHVRQITRLALVPA